MAFKEFLLAAEEPQVIELLKENPIKKWEVPSLSKIYETYALVDGNARSGG